jgi:hypothetical protein
VVLAYPKAARKAAARSRTPLKVARQRHAMAAAR